MIIRGAGVAALVALSVVVAGCGSSGGSPSNGGGGSGKDINVLAIQALSGPLAPSGKADVIGYKAAVNQIRTVILIRYDRQRRGTSLVEACVRRVSAPTSRLLVRAGCLLSRLLQVPNADKSPCVLASSLRAEEVL